MKDWARLGGAPCPRPAVDTGMPPLWTPGTPGDTVPAPPPGNDPAVGAAAGGAGTCPPLKPPPAPPTTECVAGGRPPPAPPEPPPAPTTACVVPCAPPPATPPGPPEPPPTPLGPPVPPMTECRSSLLIGFGGDASPVSKPFARAQLRALPPTPSASRIFCVATIILSTESRLAFPASALQRTCTACISASFSGGSFFDARISLISLLPVFAMSDNRLRR